MNACVTSAESHIIFLPNKHWHVPIDKKVPILVQIMLNRPIAHIQEDLDKAALLNTLCVNRMLASTTKKCKWSASPKRYEILSSSYSNNDRFFGLRMVRKHWKMILFKMILARDSQTGFSLRNGWALHGHCSTKSTRCRESYFAGLRNVWLSWPGLCLNVLGILLGLSVLAG